MRSLAGSPLQKARELVSDIVSVTGALECLLGSAQIENLYTHLVNFSELPSSLRPSSVDDSYL